MRLYLLYVGLRSRLLYALPFAWAKRIRLREMEADIRELIRLCKKSEQEAREDAESLLGADALRIERHPALVRAMRIYGDG
jgi:hypothetical protein